MGTINSYKKLHIILSALAITILITACSQEELERKVASDSSTIRFSMDASKDMATKSAVGKTYEGSMVLSAEDGTNLLLDIYSEDSEDNLLAEEVTTKGTPVTSSNLATLFDGTSDSKRLAVRSFLPTNSTTPYIDDYIKYTGTSGNPWPANGGPYYWPKVGVLDFWAWAPKSLNPTIDNSGLHFSYSTPAVSADHKDAKNQTELLASYTSAGKDSYSGEVPLSLSHLLSGVKVKIGKTPAGTVTAITISKVKNSGNCTYTKSKAVTWTTGTSTSDYCQAFNKHVDENPTGATSQEITSDSDGTVFMFIPQTLDGSTQKLSLSFKNDVGVEKVFTGAIPAGTSGKWEAGKTYTYTLSNEGGEVDVLITDEVNNNVKSNVVIKNIGGAWEYIRAAIFGSWYDSDHKIVANWSYNAANPSASGFVNLPSNDTGDWIYNSTDGFYYYKYPVIPNQVTATALFTSFTAGAAPVTGAHLEMTIAVQCVEWDSQKTKLGTAWTNAPVSKISASLKQ